MNDDRCSRRGPNNTSGASKVAGTTSKNGNHMPTAAAQAKPPAIALDTDTSPLSLSSRYRPVITQAKAMTYELPVCVKFKSPFEKMKHAAKKTESQRSPVSVFNSRYNNTALASPAMKFKAINRNITLCAGSGPTKRLDSGWKTLNRSRPSGRQSKWPKSQKEFSARKSAAVGF